MMMICMAARENASSAPASNSKTCILVVEDDPNDALLLERSLQKVRGDVPIRKVSHGLEAQAYLRGDGDFANRNLHPMPSLVLLDLKMPMMNGMELLDWLQHSAEFSSLPVVVLSGSAREEDMSEARRLRAVEYIVKPFDFEEWKAVAMRLISRWLKLGGPASDLC
ncbi:MAG TPA: response regulator [Verrucomicrobiae bacterium]|nr:response regulator [Verrucomicrobiae bacterium]